MYLPDWYTFILMHPIFSLVVVPSFLILAILVGVGYWVFDKKKGKDE